MRRWHLPPVLTADDAPQKRRRRGRSCQLGSPSRTHPCLAAHAERTGGVRYGEGLLSCATTGCDRQQGGLRRACRDLGQACAAGHQPGWQARPGVASGSATPGGDPQPAPRLAAQAKHKSHASLLWVCALHRASAWPQPQPRPALNNPPLSMPPRRQAAGTTGGATPAPAPEPTRPHPCRRAAARRRLGCRSAAGCAPAAGVAARSAGGPLYNVAEDTAAGMHHGGPACYMTDRCMHHPLLANPAHN